MRTYIVAFLLSALTTFALTPLLRIGALRFGFVDEPDSRKVHTHPIPRVGGIATAIAFFVPVLGLFFLDNKISSAYLDDSAKILGLAIGAFVIVLLGLLDDLRSLSAWQKLPVQIAVAGLAYAVGFRLSGVGNPFGDPIAFGWLTLPLTLLWIVGIMNAINLIDGLDGLAGGIALFAVVTLFVLGVVRDNTILSLTSVALAGALIGFLRHNFNPATIFMGDSGSLFLGYVISVNSIWSSSKSSTAVSLAIPIVVLGLPILDTFMSLFRRFIRGVPLFSADREHIHHKLLDKGLSQRQTVLALYGGSIMLAAGGMVLMFANAALSAVVIGGVALAAIMASRGLGYLSLPAMTRSIQFGLLRRHRLEAQVQELDHTEASILRAPTLQDVLDEACAMASRSGLRALQCEVLATGPQGAVEAMSCWPQGCEFDEAALTFSLDWALGDMSLRGCMRVQWPDLEPNVSPPDLVLYRWLAMVIQHRSAELISPQLTLDPASCSSASSSSEVRP